MAVARALAGMSCCAAAKRTEGLLFPERGGASGLRDLLKRMPQREDAGVGMRGAHEGESDGEGVYETEGDGEVGITGDGGGGAGGRR